MESEITNKKPLKWTSKNKRTKINNLKELLDTLIGIQQENIDKEIEENKNNLIAWMEQNYSNKFELIAELKSSVKEFTPQQFREKIIRILRKAV